MKLSMFGFHLGNDKAERYFNGLCSDLNIVYKGRASEQKFEIRSGANLTVIDGKTELDNIKLHGRAKLLQHLHDNKDLFLKSIIEMGALTTNRGIKATITVNFGSFTESVTNGLVEAPEIALANDIVLYRKAAVKELNRENLAGFARAYRAALHSAVSLIDCVLHRYSFHVGEIVPAARTEYENIALLSSRASIDERLGAWMSTFATHKQDDFKVSKNWNHFCELKDARNEITHPTLPANIYELKKVVRILNFLPSGIGGMLADMRRYSQTTENIGFIQHVKSAPMIQIVKS